MAHLGESNPLADILTTPNCLDIEGAEEIQLTDSTGFREALASAQTDPNTPTPEVYEWRTTRLPAHEILPMSVVKDLVISLHQDVEASRHVTQTSTMTLDEFRAWLINGNPRYAEFFRKMPRLFRVIVSARNTPINLAHIMRLIEMRRHQETSNQTLDQKQAQVGAYFRANFSRPAKPGEEKEAVRTGRGFRGTPLTRDQVAAELANRRK